MVSKPEILGVVLTIIALLFEIFVLVSGAGNLPVLRAVYFAQVEYFGNFVNMGLWGSCYGGNAGYKECSVPTAPFKWPEAEGLTIHLSVNVPDTIWLAILILYWIAFLAMALAMQVTLFTHFKKLPDFIVAGISLMATGATFIIFVIVTVCAGKLKDAANSYGGGVSGSFGIACWLLLGAVIASGLATIIYTFLAVTRRGKSAAETFKY